MIYDYKCTECGDITEAFRSVAQRDMPVKCESCGGRAEFTLSIGSVVFNTGKSGNIPGLCTSLPGDPVYVKSKHHFKELCKERNAGTPVGLH